jgi:hypothetical protein
MMPYTSRLSMEQLYIDNIIIADSTETTKNKAATLKGVVVLLDRNHHILYNIIAQIRKTGGRYMWEMYRSEEFRKKSVSLLSKAEQISIDIDKERRSKEEKFNKCGTTRFLGLLSLIGFTCFERLFLFANCR